MIKSHAHLAAAVALSIAAFATAGQAAHEPQPPKETAAAFTPEVTHAAGPTFAHAILRAS